MVIERASNEHKKKSSLVLFHLVLFVLESFGTFPCGWDHWKILANKKHLRPCTFIAVQNNLSIYLSIYLSRGLVKSVTRNLFFFNIIYTSLVDISVYFNLLLDLVVGVHINLSIYLFIYLSI